MLFPRILKMDQQVKSNSLGAVLMKGRAVTLVRMVFDSVDYSCLVVNIVRFDAKPYQQLQRLGDGHYVDREDCQDKKYQEYAYHHTPPL